MFKRIQKILKTQQILVFSIVYFIIYSLPFVVNIFSKSYSFIYKVNLVFIGFLLVYLLNILILNMKTKKYYIPILFLCNSLALYFMNSFLLSVNYEAISNLFGTNFNEAIEFINIKLILYLIFFGIVPTLLYFKFFKSSWKFETVQTRVKISIGILFYVLFNLLLTLFSGNYLLFLKKNKHSIDYLMPINYIKANVDFISKTTFIKSRDIIEVANKNQNNLVEHRKKNLIVFLLGESARADNFSLNGYSRNTSDMLKDYNIINFSNFYSCGTSTFISVPCMFSHLDRKNFSVKKTNRYENLIDVFKKIGYRVNWYSNNGSCKGVCDRINFEMAEADYDMDMLKYLERDTKNYDEDLFIVLHQRGSHGPQYSNRYPKEFEIFTPVCNDEIQNCEYKDVVNAYDNTIYYTSYFIKKIIEFLKTKENDFNIMFIFVSDHGDSLGENKQIMHGYPYRIANDYQKHIPFMFWFSSDFVEDYGIDVDNLNKIGSGEYSHDNIFHSFMGLFGISSDYYDKGLDLFFKEL